MVNELNETVAEDILQAGAEVVNALASHYKGIMWTGIGLLVVGILSLVFPQFSSLSVTFLVGWLLMFGGIFAFFYAFTLKGTGPFFGAFLGGILNVGVGIYFLTHPEVGAIVLTLIVAGLLLVESAFFTMLAFEIKPVKGWGWMLFSGIASAVLGIIIAANIQTSALFTIAVIVGMNLIFSGIALIMLSRDLKSIAT